MSDPQPPFSPYEWYSLTPEEQAAAVTELRRVRDVELVVERDKVEAAHSAVLAGATGLRRAILELHAPTFEEFGAKPSCSGCYDSDYGHDDWPCETYVLARDYPEDK
jgi:hypothetical protein